MMTTKVKPKPLVKAKQSPSMVLKVDYSVMVEKAKRKLKRVYRARKKALAEIHKKNLDELTRIRHSTPRGEEHYRKYLPIAEEEYKKALARVERWYKRKLTELEKLAKSKGVKDDNDSKSKVSVKTEPKSSAVKPVKSRPVAGFPKVMSRKWKSRRGYIVHG